MRSHAKADKKNASIMNLVVELDFELVSNFTDHRNLTKTIQELSDTVNVNMVLDKLIVPFVSNDKQHGPELLDKLKSIVSGSATATFACVAHKFVFDQMKLIENDTTLVANIV